MKTFLFLLAGFLLCSFTVEVNNTLNDEHFRGKVKTITEYEIFIVKGKEVLYDKHVNSYDENGNETLRRSYNAHDSVNFPDFMRRYKYNESGNKIEEIIYNEDGSISWKTTCNYDKNGMMTEANRFHNNGTLEERYTYQYDLNGNKTLEVSYNSKGEVNCKSTSKYDESGRLIEEFDDCGSISWLGDGARVKTSNRYDSKANLIEHIEYDRSNKVLYDAKFNDTVFDSAGNWTMQTAIEQNHRYEKHDTIIRRREISYY